MVEIVASADDVWRLNYPDFVGFINQWNVLPGAYSTINKWAVFGHVRHTSHVLQLACTTGFQLRELALLTKCSGLGVDVSVPSVEMAEHNRQSYAPAAAISYVVADAYRFETDQMFSHLLVGGGLGFFKEPDFVLERFVGFLSGDAYVLASPFWIRDSVPEALVDQARNTFGITPTVKGYKEVMRSFRRLEILYEDRSALFPETGEELEEYCTATITRACAIRGIEDPSTRAAMAERLLQVRQMSNALRPYQEYATLVLRRRESTYPNRYVELF